MTGSKVVHVGLVRNRVQNNDIPLAADLDGDYPAQPPLSVVLPPGWQPLNAYDLLPDLKGLHVVFVDEFLLHRGADIEYSNPELCHTFEAKAPAASDISTATQGLCLCRNG
jgi:hypothetical protein